MPHSVTSMRSVGSIGAAEMVCIFVAPSFERNQLIQSFAAFGFGWFSMTMTWLVVPDSTPPCKSF